MRGFHEVPVRFGSPYKGVDANFWQERRMSCGVAIGARRKLWPSSLHMICVWRFLYMILTESFTGTSIHRLLIPSFSAVYGVDCLAPSRFSSSGIEA